MEYLKFPLETDNDVIKSANKATADGGAVMFFTTSASQSLTEFLSEFSHFLEVLHNFFG